MADNTKCYIAVHLGSGDGKVVLGSVKAGALTTETLHEFSIPRINLGGHSYWDIYAAYGEVLKGLALAGARKIPLESIGIDAWATGIVCVAKDGSFLAPPRLYPDVLSPVLQAKFFKRMEKRYLYEAAGVNVLDSHAALQLYGMKREKSVALDDAKYLMFIPDAFVYLLTGKRGTGLQSLSAAGLLDRSTGKLSKEVLGACKVSRKRFPAIVQSGAKPVKLSEEIAQATGLARVPVRAVAGQSLAAAVTTLPLVTSGSSQTASVYATEGSAFLMLGRVSVMGVATACPIVNDQTYDMNFSNEAGAGGNTLLMKRIAGTDLLERCVAAWRAAGLDYGPEDLARMAREGAESTAQLDPEDPALLYDSDIPDAVVRYCSLRSMTVPADNASIIRLIYSSLAEKFGDTFVKLQSITPFRLKTLHIIDNSSSGFCADPVLCRLIAEECSVPVTFGPSDASVLGNLLLQSSLPLTVLPAPEPVGTGMPSEVAQDTLSDTL